MKRLLILTLIESYQATIRFKSSIWRCRTCVGCGSRDLPKTKSGAEVGHPAGVCAVCAAKIEELRKEIASTIPV
jgi:hypothetical protein